MKKQTDNTDNKKNMDAQQPVQQPPRQQLMMVKRDIRQLPPIVLPEGYSVRSYKEGDGKAWENIILESFGKKYDFEEFMLKNKAFMPERVFFLCYGDEVVATASAWHRDEIGTITGSLHMVGILKSHAGHGLGYWISLAALYRMREEGRIRSVLRTDDFRLPAVKTYLRLGYEPILIDESQESRWRDVFAAIGRADLADTPLLSKAVFDPFAETEDGRYKL
ncbi:MAG: GNAT family N-acetyltransferase [Eubacteriales bacterium]|nr:GNAT family N-acetyltransferase [Eubacteriales bacterium]